MKGISISNERTTTIAETKTSKRKFIKGSGSVLSDENNWSHQPKHHRHRHNNPPSSAALTAILEHTTATHAAVSVTDTFIT